MYLWNSLLQLAWIYFSYLLRSTLLKASLFQASFLSETYHHGNCYIVKSLSQDPAGTITADLRQCWSLTVKNQQASSLQISDNADLWHYTLVGCKVQLQCQLGILVIVIVLPNVCFLYVASTITFAVFTFTKDLGIANHTDRELVKSEMQVWDSKKCLKTVHSFYSPRCMCLTSFGSSVKQFAAARLDILSYLLQRTLLKASLFHASFLSKTHRHGNR